MNKLPAPPARYAGTSTREKIIWAVVGVIVPVVLAFGLYSGRFRPGTPNRAEFVNSHGGPGGVCDVLVSEVPDHLAEQWGRRCITGAG
ncbi:MAG: hypothetical protein ACRDG9_06830 [Actinomycetota bacterium]